MEKREILVTSNLTVHWPGAKQAFRIYRRRKHKEKTTEEIVYGITSLSPPKASPERLLALVRSHWAIENQLHWVRDVTMKEDACRVRKGNAPQVLAAFRNAALHLLQQVPDPSRPTAMLRLSLFPLQAVGLLNGLPPK